MRLRRGNGNVLDLRAPWQDPRGMDIQELAAAVIVDFEAVPGSHGSWFPTEIGVAQGRGHAAAFLTPNPAWLPARPSWDGHHQSLRGALEEGRPFAQVATWFLALTHGRTMLSDACFFDQPLLETFLAGQGATIRPLVPFFPAFDACAAGHGVPRTDINAWISEIDEGRGAPHRAGEDARVRAGLVARLAERCGIR
jgi:hypothetical protein